MGVFDSVYLEDEPGARIGGPLWLLAIGLGLAVLEMVQGGWTILHLFAGDAWPNLTTPGTEVYHPLWGRVIAWELLTILVLFPYAVALLLCMSQRRRVVPRLVIGWFVLGLAFSIVDLELVARIPSAVEQGASANVTVRMVISALGAIFWTPYLLISKRAKRTFVW